MASGKFVAYYRVSTARQESSGLGLDAQRAAVQGFLNGGRWQLVGEFQETESGGRDDRPALAQALDLCRLTGAKLLIAKLDRLSRDAHFLLGLQKAGVRFVAADMPDANELTVGLLAVVAQHERRMISERTKAALAAAKARGQRLGNPNGAKHLDPSKSQPRAVAAVKAKAKDFALGMRATLEAIAREGVTSAAGVAAELNRRGIETPRKRGQWHAASVARLQRRVAS